MKDASLYSMNCKNVKYTPRKIVINKKLLHFFLFPIIIKWWDAVNVTPDLNKIIVFIRGIPIGLNALIPLQGHLWPIKMSGDRDEWKNAQKKERKKKISDVINNIIPNFKPLITSFVCLPSKVDSRIMSRHQFHEINLIKPIFTKKIVFLGCWLNIRAVEKTVLNSWKDAKIGHGLRVTKWNGIFGISFQNLKT